MPLLRFLIIILFCLPGLKVAAQPLVTSYPLKTGDLLFQDLDCGGLCDAIEKVTKGVQGRHFSHVGLVYTVADSTFVLEAIGKDVHLTPLDKFLHRQVNAKGQPQVMIGRLKKRYQYLTPAAIQYAIAQLGTPYDDAFVYNNGKYYCSELIYDAYKTANKQKPFFRLYPMTFKDPATHKTFPAWVDYYKELQLEIPEGEPGCNPGGLSTSNKTEIVASFY